MATVNKLTSIAAFASLRRRSLRLLSPGSDASAFSRSRSRSAVRPRSSSNVTLELFLCARLFAAASAAAELPMSLPSTGVIGVRPLLESPVELAGLFPRSPVPFLGSAKGFDGAAKVVRAVDGDDEVEDLSADLGISAGRLEDAGDGDDAEAIIRPLS